MPKFEQNSRFHHSRFLQHRWISYGDYPRGNLHLNTSMKVAICEASFEGWRAFNLNFSDRLRELHNDTFSSEYLHHKYVQLGANVL